MFVREASLPPFDIRYLQLSMVGGRKGSTDRAFGRWVTLCDVGTTTPLLLDVRRLLITAMAVKPEDGTSVSRGHLHHLQQWADRLLGGERTDPVEEKIRNRLAKQRDHLFTFSTLPEVDTPNNAAERALRPAIIARKLSCGNQAPQGKKTWEILVKPGTRAF